MKVLCLCIFVFVLVLQLPSGGNAECCKGGLRNIGVGGSFSGANVNFQFVCHDCTYPTPCCAHGKCNVFCCNCDRGCRGGCRTQRSLGGWTKLLSEMGPAGTAHDVIQSGDIDGDGKLSFEEAHHYVSKRSAYDAETRDTLLSELDVNNDKFFSPEEIDW